MMWTQYNFSPQLHYFILCEFKCLKTPCQLITSDHPCYSFRYFIVNYISISFFKQFHSRRTSRPKEGNVSSVLSHFSFFMVLFFEA